MENSTKDLTGQRLQSFIANRLNAAFYFDRHILYITVNTGDEAVTEISSFIPEKIVDNLIENKNDLLESAIEETVGNALILQFEKSGTIIIPARANVYINIADIPVMAGADIEINPLEENSPILKEWQWNQLTYNQQLLLQGVLHKALKLYYNLRAIPEDFPLLYIERRYDNVHIGQIVELEPGEYILRVTLYGNPIRIYIYDNEKSTMVTEEFTPLFKYWNGVSIPFKLAASSKVRVVIEDNEKKISGNECEFTEISVVSLLDKNGVEYIRNGNFMKAENHPGYEIEENPIGKWGLWDQKKNAEDIKKRWVFAAPGEIIGKRIWEYLDVYLLKYFINYFTPEYFDEPKFEQGINKLNSLWNQVVRILKRISWV